jgi:hypothetical protein
MAKSNATCSHSDRTPPVRGGAAKKKKRLEVAGGGLGRTPSMLKSASRRKGKFRQSKGRVKGMPQQIPLGSFHRLSGLVSHPFS